MFKRILKFCMWIVFFTYGMISFSYAQEQYHYFYSQTCGHCLHVEQYFEETWVDDFFQINKYEIFNQTGAMDVLKTFLAKMKLPLSQVGTPFLVIEGEDNNLQRIMSSAAIIDYFTKLKAGERVIDFQNWDNLSEDLDEYASTNPWKFLWIMVPMAIADSINPCAFAVMLLLLSTIFSKSKSRKKTLFSGFFFAFAIFVSYLLLGVGFFSFLERTTTGSIIFKRIVGVLGILIGLWNIKDYFWYGGAWFLMEVPLAWRPKMMKLIQSVVSPKWAFFIGILVSLFLLPCSSGPYMVILGLLKTGNISLQWLWFWYLVLYNLIFILPMLIITILVSTGQATVEKIAKFKNKNTKLLHWVLGLLMIILGVYVIFTAYYNL